MVFSEVLKDLSVGRSNMDGWINSQVSCNYLLNSDFGEDTCLQVVNIGIKHDFLFINIRKVPREVFAQGFQHLPRDLANVNE